MKKRSVEVSVGVFVLIGLVCVAYLTVKLGKMELLGGRTYRLTAHFSSVSGLQEGGVVDVAGVEVGKVVSIVLDPETRSVAVVTMRIREEVTLDDEVIASVKTSGLIGDKYIRLTPGGSETPLKDGDRIAATESAIDLESMISKYAFGGV